MTLGDVVVETLTPMPYFVYFDVWSFRVWSRIRLSGGRVKVVQVQRLVLRID